MHCFDRSINALLRFIFPISDVQQLKILKKIPANLREMKIQRHAIYYIYEYRQENVKKAMLRMKQYGLHEYVEFFANSIYDVLLELLEERLAWESLSVTVCPIPLHRKKGARRGFDQNILIAKALEEKFDKKSKIQVNTRLLKRIKNTKEQKKLKKKERFENLKNAFQISDKSVLGKNDIIIIFDDITTSGATLLSAKKALHKAGFKKEIIMMSIAH